MRYGCPGVCLQARTASGGALPLGISEPNAQKSQHFASFPYKLGVPVGIWVAVVEQGTVIVTV